MRLNAAYGIELEDFDVVAVDENRWILTIIRSILTYYGVRRIRTFDAVDDALESILADHPNLVLTDWKMTPTSGYQLLRLLRHRSMGPLCTVPIGFISTYATRSLVERAYHAGAHLFMVKPFAPAELHKRMEWLTFDEQPFVLNESGFYNLLGRKKLITKRREVVDPIERVRIRHALSTRQFSEIHKLIDHLFGDGPPVPFAQADPVAPTIQEDKVIEDLVGDEEAVPLQANPYDFASVREPKAANDK